MIYQFGRFELDPERFVLSRDASPIEVEPKVFELLRHLVASSSRIVSKEELVEVVWEGRFVSDAAVVRAVQKARRVLDDDGHEPRSIVAVYGRGYRFTPEVAIVASDSSAPADSASKGTLGRGEPSRPAAAVVPLVNLSGRAEHAWIGVALAELVAAELAADGGARLASSSKVAELARDFPALAGSGALDRRTLDVVRSLLGVDCVLTGSFLAAGGAEGRLRANLTIHDAASGEPQTTVVEDGRSEEVAELSTRLAAALRPAIGGRLGPAAEARAWRLQPSAPAAARPYVEGIALLRAGDPRAARPRLEEAVAAEPSFALAHAALAAAHRELGYEAKSRQSADQALRLASTLPREHRLLVEGLHHECGRDWGAAAQSYTALWKFFPDDLEYGLLLLRAQVAANALDAARSTIDSLRDLAPPMRDDPRLDLAEADLAAARSDPTRMRDLAALAARKASARGVRRFEAQALLVEGKAWRYLGDFAKAIASYRRAGELFAAVGDESGVAETVQRRGASLFHHGDRVEAEALIADAHDRFVRLGRPGGAAVCRLNLAIQAHERGEYEAAARLYHEARDVFRELGDREFESQCLVGLVGVRYSEGAMQAGVELCVEGLAVARSARSRRNEAEFQIRMGECLYQLGRLGDSAAAIEQSLAGFREAEDALGEASALNALGSVRNREGELAESARLHLEALARFRRQQHAYRTADALNRAANALQAQGKLEAALELHRESLVLHEQIGHRFGAAIASYGVATDLLGLGRLREAEPLYQGASETFAALGNLLYAAETRRGLGELAVARGDLAAAREVVGAAVDYVQGHRAPELERNVRLLSARLDLEEGEPSRAERELRSYLAAAPAALDPDSEAAVRDLLAQALLEQGRAEEARAAVRRALALTERSQRQGLRLSLEITAARIAAELGDPSAAIVDLLGVAERAAELGLVARRLEAQIDLALVRLRAGDEAAARAALAERAREADELGFGLLARRTSVARRAWPRARGG